jgi:hypothetical protein
MLIIPTLEVLMLRLLPFALIVASALIVLSCGDDSQSTSITVRWDETVDFTQFQTFSVITADRFEPPPDFELDEDQMVFNDLVNDVIIEAMQAEPVCLTLIPPNQVTEENQPDLWAANGLGRTTEGGYYYECVGGWWWGYWGWYWDACAYWYPVYVEYDVGNLLIPVGPPPPMGEDPVPIFAGLAQSIEGTGPDVETKVREAVHEIFERWPDPRSCPPSQ